MPNIKSAKKRVKTAQRNALRNTNMRSAMRTAIRAVREAIQAGDSAAALAKLPAAFSRIDKAVKRKIIHRNAAARYKSRLAAKIKAI
ncbi:MAG: 30S ribosomal protein S20 [Candidatus Melainabacteria bacterium]|nr:30S ribosomal protein S20 [Candidatus Melainabacteria bacterium]